jgi:hypothetical protein
MMVLALITGFAVFLCRMHLLVTNMADPDISDYELRNSSTVFEELEVSVVDFLSISVLNMKVSEFCYYMHFHYY